MPDLRTLGFLAVAIAGCANERTPATTVSPVTWRDDVAPILGARCATSGCHTRETPAGHYALTSYLGALGAGTDAISNAIAGDPGSLLLAKIEGTTVEPWHTGFGDVVQLLQRWVVDSRLAYEPSRIHDPGLMNPADAQFHGAELRRRDWNFPLCAGCHGADFAGSVGAPSCLTCHAQGPTACDTCHGNPPTSGAHHTHVVGRGIACAECHRVPTRWDDPGHILDEHGHADPAPAEIILGPLANRDAVPPRRSGPATYDPATKGCQVVYCHGGILGDTAATNTRPMWDAGPATVGCGTCHGTPPANHVAGQTDCASCHPTTVIASGQLTATHIDGVIQVGDGSSPCTGCHGSGTQSAPPRGLHGETSTATLAVGAHRAHLEANHLRGPIACVECHLVPTVVDSAGHIDSDSPAEVFPLAAGVIARNDGASPGWDRTTATCTGVYCHGGGVQLGNDLSPGIRAPVWTIGNTQATCGTCHGIPPLDPSHTPGMPLTQCVGCHPRTVDAFGNIIFTMGPNGLTSEHIDGAVDVF